MDRITVFDAHCDTIYRILHTGESLFENRGSVSLTRTGVAFDRYCQFFALFEDAGKNGHATYTELLACFKGQMDMHSDLICHCRSREEALQANSDGKVAAFLSVEGAELLGCSLDWLDQAAADGVVAVNLTWNHSNLISGSSREEPDRGLSEIGRRFVRRMEAHDILVDVSHLSDRGFWDVAEMATKPFIASHSNCRSIHNHPRNLTDEQITAIINRKGVVGLNFYRDFIGRTRDLDAVHAHLYHILQLGGVQTVALGGDWDGCHPIDDLKYINDLTKLYEYLLSKNYSESFLQDFFFNNLMRVVRETCITSVHAAITSD